MSSKMQTGNLKRGLTVLIATYNASGMIEETLKRLAVMDKVANLPWEILLVDNNSTDDTVEKARRFWKEPSELRIINETQQGAGYAAFRGMKEANYNYIGFVDQDNWVQQDWMINAVRHLDATENAAIICAKGTPVFETEAPPWFYRYQQNFAVGAQSESNGIAKNLHSFFYNAGSILRKEAFDELLRVGFVPLMKSRATNQVLAGDDTEVQILFKLLGWEIHYYDDIRFEHFMPRQRLTFEYFRKLRMGMGASSVYLGIYRDALTAHVEGDHRQESTWEKALHKSFMRTFRDPLALAASFIPKYASNHRVATFWSSFGEFQERFRLKSKLEEVRIQLNSWLDSWVHDM